MVSVLAPLLNRCRQLYLFLAGVDFEVRIIAEFVSAQQSVDSSLSGIDMGCGYGRNLEALLKRGLTVTGVDVNPELVKDCRGRGLSCISSTDFFATEQSYDWMLLAHIIEHFQPNELKAFLETCFSRVRDGGTIVIATPLLSPYFFDDFDHIKPYSHVGLLMLFSDRLQQVQYQSPYCLTLERFWYRRSPWKLMHSNAKVVRNRFTPLARIIDLFGLVFFTLSRGLIGRVDGWVGAFRVVRRK